MPAYPADELLAEDLTELLTATEGVAEVCQAADRGWLVATADRASTLLVTLADGRQLIVRVSEVQL
jgi:hypothetical protein